MHLFFSIQVSRYLLHFHFNGTLLDSRTRFVRSWGQSFLLDSNRCHQYSNERSCDFCLVCLQGHGLAQSYIQVPIFEKVEHTFWLNCMTFFKRV